MTNQSIAVGNAKNVVSIKASLVAFIHEEKPGLHVSYCPVLNLYSQGATQKEAKKNIIEATTLFIESCIEDHTLEKVLEDCGFKPATGPAGKKHRSKQTAPPPEFAASKPFTIPTELPMMAHGW